MFVEFTELSQNISTAHENVTNFVTQVNAHDLSNHTLVLAATNNPNPENKSAATAGAFIGAGLAMTGALGVGIGQGYVGGKAALATAKNPDEYPRIRAMMLIGAAIAESSAIYALIIAILLIFVAPSLN